MPVMVAGAALGAAHGVASAISMGRKNRRYAKHLRRAYNNFLAASTERQTAESRNEGARMRSVQGAMRSADRGTGTKNQFLLESVASLQSLFNDYATRTTTNQEQRNARETYQSQIAALDGDDPIMGALAGAMQGMMIAQSFEELMGSFGGE